MDLRALTTFIQVAESSSFTRAAEKLGYAQPTVSVQIKQLEKELGIQLFDRIGHTVRLTDKGRDALTRAQHICQLCRDMVQDSGNHAGLQGTIRLGMADSLCAFLISSRFSAFRAQYPQLSVTVTTAGTHELFRLLDHNEVDLVCTLDSHIYDTNYVIAEEEKIGVHFVVSARSPLAERNFLTPKDLIAQPFLLTEKGMSYRRLLDEWLARDSKEIQPILETGSTSLLCGLVEQDVGISFLPDYVTETAAAQGAVVRLDAQGFQPDLWKQVLYHRDKWVSPQMQAVIQHLSA